MLDQFINVALWVCGVCLAFWSIVLLVLLVMFTLGVIGMVIIGVIAGCRHIVGWVVRKARQLLATNS